MTTVLDASKALLVETAELLNREGATYVVVGGWSPYLRNSTSLIHPGTKDVDILFSDAHARGGIKEVVKAFLAAGFKVSAKHDFQVLKEVSVSGQALVFNVDLLHPSECVKNPELMVDHLNLHIQESDIGKDKFVRSMVLPSSQILFEDGMWSLHGVTCPLTGNATDVPLINEAGCVLSKCESVKLEKRMRDSFDIYMSVLNVGPNRVAKEIRKFAHLDGVKTMLSSLREFLSQKVGTDCPVLEFDARVGKYAKGVRFDDPPSNIIKAMIDAI